MAARKDKSNTAGQFQKGENAIENGRKGGLKSKPSVMSEIALKRITPEDREAALDNLIERAKTDDRSFELLLKVLGEMPDTKTSIGLTVNGLTDADRSLLEKVDVRV